MTDTSPAATLRAAADKIDPLANAVQRDLDTDDYWKCYDPATAWRDGFANGFGGISSELVALFTPAAARELARWLRAESRRLANTTHPGWQETVSPHALAFARAVLGEEATR